MEERSDFADCQSTLATSMSRKERKRVQNKDASVRYRHRKRIGTENMEDEEKKLLQVHELLKEEELQLSKKVEVLKGLIRNLYSGPCVSKKT